MVRMQVQVPRESTAVTTGGTWLPAGHTDSLAGGPGAAMELGARHGAGLGIAARGEARCGLPSPNLALWTRGGGPRDPCKDCVIGGGP